MLTPDQVLPMWIGLNVTPKNVLRMYYYWLIAYFAPLFAVFGYEVAKRGLAKPIEDELTSPSLYLEILAEICLTNVLISDLLYMISYVD